MITLINKSAKIVKDPKGFFIVGQRVYVRKHDVEDDTYFITKASEQCGIWVTSSIFEYVEDKKSKKRLSR